MREAGGPGTRRIIAINLVELGVPGPAGMVMVASPQIPRNAPDRTAQDHGGASVPCWV
jgi:hypothetical protein